MSDVGKSRHRRRTTGRRRGHGRRNSRRSRRSSGPRPGTAPRRCASSARCRRRRPQACRPDRSAAAIEARGVADPDLDPLFFRLGETKTLEPGRARRAAAGRIDHEIGRDAVLVAVTDPARTPLIVALLSSAISSCTAQFSITRTFGKAIRRRRTWPSSTGPGCQQSDQMLGADLMVTPWPIQLTSPAMSPLTPPLATTSSVQPGKKFSITFRPRASRPCAWRPCGTPLRGISDCGNASRSSTVTTA
jgi:hypothetical protein